MLTFQVGVWTRIRVVRVIRGSRRCKHSKMKGEFRELENIEREGVAMDTQSKVVYTDTR